MPNSYDLQGSKRTKGLITRYLLDENTGMAVHVSEKVLPTIYIRCSVAVEVEYKAKRA